MRLGTLVNLNMASEDTYNMNIKIKVHNLNSKVQVQDQKDLKNSPCWIDVY